MFKTQEKIIVALDVPAQAEALHLARLLFPVVRRFKVGLELFAAAGPAVVNALRAMGAEVFIDLKLHDIPHTVARAVRKLVVLEPFLITVHAAGGQRMMAAAVEAAREEAVRLGVKVPAIVAVTVLTSLTAEELQGEIGVLRPLREQVVHLALLARQAGTAGVVASAQELPDLKLALGLEAKMSSTGAGFWQPAGAAEEQEKFIFVVPGIRLPGAAADDQKRTVDPLTAVKAGADYLVIGRPITAAPDPLAAAERIVSALRCC